MFEHVTVLYGKQSGFLIRFLGFGIFLGRIFGDSWKILGVIFRGFLGPPKGILIKFWSCLVFESYMINKCFPVRVELYTVLVVFALPEALVKTLVNKPGQQPGQHFFWGEGAFLNRR